MAKKTSERGIKAIAIREGEVLHGYKDSKGLLTIGVGHLVTAGEPYKLHEPITKEESRRLLAIDLKEAENAVNSIGIPILQNEFDALVSLTFNIGSAGFKRSSIVKRLKAHATRQQVAEAILLWNKPPEIQRRRHQEYAQFLTPYPDSAATPLEKTATSPTSEATNDILQESSAETPPSPTETQTIAESNTGETIVATTTSPNVAVGKEEQVGFLKKIKLKLAGWFATLGGLTGVNEYRHQLDDLGLPGWIIIYLIIGVAVAALIWFLYEFAMHVVEWIGKRKRTDILAQINSTPTNTVLIVPQDQLDAYEKQGWVVIRRDPVTQPTGIFGK